MPDDSAGGGERGRGGRRRWAVRVVQVVLTVAVTAFIVDRVGVTAGDVAALDDRWLRPAWGLLGLASLVLLAGFGLSAMLWGRMVRELGGPRLRPLESASIYFTSNLGRYVPGKIWQLAGVAYLSRRAGVSGPLATGSAVLVQATSLAGATLVGAWALAARPGAAGAWGGWAAAGVVAAVLVATAPPVFRRIVALWFRVTGDPVPAGFEPSSAFGLRWVAVFCGNWLVYAGAFWLLGRSFGMDAGFPVLGPAFAAAYVLGYVMIFAPAGIGVREGFLVAFLEPATGAGPAAALAILARLWMTVVELLPAGAFVGIRAAGLGSAEVDP